MAIYTRRQFLHGLSTLALGTVAAASPTILPTAMWSIIPTLTRPAGSCETRAGWLNPESFATPQACAATLATIQQANLNTVFVAAYSRKSNHGWSEQASFELLYDAVLAARYSVHVWLSSKDRTGKGSLDYTDPREWDAHTEWCLDWLATYPGLAGVHLDNLRYPDTLRYIDQRRVNGIAATVKACYAAIKASYPHKLLTAFCDNVDPQPIAANDYLPPWFTQWLAAHPENAYIYNGRQYRPSLLKTNPIGWLKGGHIDGLLPGDYTTSGALWRRRLVAWQSFLEGELRKVWFGVAWMPSQGEIIYPDGYSYPKGGYDAAAVAAQIIDARTYGMKGFSMFEFGQEGVDDRPLVQALTVDSSINTFQAPFQDPASMCANQLSQIFIPLVKR